MEMRIVFQGVDDPPRLNDLDLNMSTLDMSNNPAMTVCLIEKGMASGEPSVIILSTEDDVTVILQTSLDKWLMAATAFVSYAKEHWNWEMLEGYFSLMPMEKDARKEMLENIKKELEEWDETEE